MRLATTPRVAFGSRVAVKPLTWSRWTPTANTGRPLAPRTRRHAVPARASFQVGGATAARRLAPLTTPLTTRATTRDGGLVGVVRAHLRRKSEATERACRRRAIVTRAAASGDGTGGGQIRRLDANPARPYGDDPRSRPSVGAFSSDDAKDALAAVAVTYAFAAWRWLQWPAAAPTAALVPAPHVAAAVALGATAVAAPLVALAAHPGVNYGVRWPLLLRAAFGVRGARALSSARSLVLSALAAAHFIAGAEALHVLLATLTPAASVVGAGSWSSAACYAAAWIMQSRACGGFARAAIVKGGASFVVVTALLAAKHNMFHGGVVKGAAAAAASAAAATTRAPGVGHRVGAGRRVGVDVRRRARHRRRGDGRGGVRRDQVRQSARAGEGTRGEIRSATPDRGGVRGGVRVHRDEPERRRRARIHRRRTSRDSSAVHRARRARRDGGGARRRASLLRRERRDVRRVRDVRQRGTRRARPTRRRRGRARRPIRRRHRGGGARHVRRAHGLFRRAQAKPRHARARRRGRFSG